MEFSNHLTPGRAMIGQWSVDRYVDVLRWPAILGMAVLVILLAREWTLTWIIAVEAAAVIGVSFRVSQRGGQRVEGLTAGALVGFALGLAASITKLVLNLSAVLLANVIAETLWTAIIASLLGASVITLRKLFNR